MKCDEFRKYGEVWLDRELESGMAAKMEKHQRECTACAQYLKQLQQGNDQLVRALKQPAPDDYSWTAAELRIRQTFERRAAEPVAPAVLQNFGSWLRQMIWPESPAWRALAALWLLTAMVQMLAHFTDGHGDTPKLAGAASFAEYTLSQALRMEKTLANSDGETSRPEAQTPPQPRGALEPRSRDFYG